MVECVSIKPDSDDICDALCCWHLTNDHVCAAWRHQPTDLRSNQLRHLGFPTKTDTFALSAGCCHSARRLKLFDGFLQRFEEWGRCCRKE